jgi:hypothetical protein
MAEEDGAAMTLLDLVQAELARWPQPRETGGRIVVPTHCMFGSGGVVRVVIEGRGDSFVVHDGGAAIDEFASGGGEMPGAAKLLRSFLRDGGFGVNDKGEIHSPVIPRADLPPTIALIANAAKEASEHLTDRWKPKVRRDFRLELRKLLRAEFPHLRVEEEVRYAGKSAKQHRFAFSVPMAAGGQLLIDAVAHEQSAISASVLRNLDVRNANAGGLEQRVIFDDSEEWRAEDLNLLKLGATPVPFSRAHDVLGRFAA